LFYGWFRYYQYNKFQQSWILYASLCVIEGISIAMGFVFFMLLKVRVHLIWTSFAILPIVVGAFLLFLGNWISNDYFFYDKKGDAQAAEKDRDITKIVDETNA
jgi:predicted membrane chloride channel (bestrophin family)